MSHKWIVILAFLIAAIFMLGAGLGIYWQSWLLFNGCILLLIVEVIVFCFWAGGGHGWMPRRMTIWFNDLCYVNNARLRLMLYLALFFTVEAIMISMIYGLPRSPLVSLKDDVSAEVQTYGDGNIKDRIHFLFFGDMPDGKAETPTPSYSSWWWWGSALMTWAIYFIYLPIASRDEAARLIKAIGAVFRRRKTTAASAAPSPALATAAVAATTAAAGVVTGWRKWLNPLWLIEYISDDVVGDLISGWFKKK